MIARGTVLVSGARTALTGVRLAIEQLGGRIVLVSSGESVIASSTVVSDATAFSRTSPSGGTATVITRTGSPGEPGSPRRS